MIRHRSPPPPITSRARRAGPPARAADAEPSVAANSTAQELTNQTARLLTELAAIECDLIQGLAARSRRASASDGDDIARFQEREAILGERLQACHAQHRMLRAIERRNAGNRLNAVQSQPLCEGITGPTDAQGDRVGMRSAAPAPTLDSGAVLSRLPPAGLADWIAAQSQLLDLIKRMEEVTGFGSTSGDIKRDVRSSRDDFSGAAQR